MTIEKRGSEKLLDTENGLCALTPDELAQVAGGAELIDPWQIKDIFHPSKFPDVFPRGQFPPDLLRKLSMMDQFR